MWIDNPTQSQTLAPIKKPKNRWVFKYGGERGSRTLDTLRYTHFPGVLLRPLGHLTNKTFTFNFQLSCLNWHARLRAFITLRGLSPRRGANVHNWNIKRNVNGRANRQKNPRGLNGAENVSGLRGFPCKDSQSKFHSYPDLTLQEYEDGRLQNRFSK